MPENRGDTSNSTASGSNGNDSPELAVPGTADIPTPEAVLHRDDATGYVVWHRKHLRTDDHVALSRAVADGEAICPLFVFDPTFYNANGLACDARICFLHEAVASLNSLYAATAGQTIERATTNSSDHIVPETPLGSQQSDSSGRAGGPEASSDPPDASGLTIGYGDPVTLLSRFVDRGWSVLTMATPTSRYGTRRDERISQACGDAVEFVSGDGLVRDAEWSRADWQTHIEDWLTNTQHTPGWDDHTAVRVVLDTGVTPTLVGNTHDIAPAKTKIPEGTHRAATTRLREFADRIQSYPGNISAPQDARGGTSGLSPYINFGLLSVRQVHQYVTENAPACRGREMFTSRLVWNMHYNQKLVDWPGWTERAVNPVFEGRNEDTHDTGLVDAWKRGQTGFPMVDASMRCLRQTGWLNFRMRAMCASFFSHILEQPWWIGAEWYHHHLIDSDVAINYTQWQSQAGLIGKPSQRVYNPRKQVRDHDPDGEWITEWIPELEPLPSQFLDRPERTPLAIQEDCGVVIGEEYSRPVVDFETRREAFWSRYERRQPEAAKALGRPEIARRASFSGGYAAAKAIAEKHGPSADDGSDGRQISFADLSGDTLPATDTGGSSSDHSERPGTVPGADDHPREDGTTVPTGTGREAGEPSPDDRAAVSDGLEGADGDDGDSPTSGSEDTSTEQTTMQRFN